MRRRASPRGLLGGALALVLVLTGLVTRPAAAQLDPAMRDRAVAAVVELALIADVTEDGQVEHDYLPVGSGTIVAPNGVVLTTWHVVDHEANRDRIAQFEAKQQAAGHALSIDLNPDRVLLLTTTGVDAPKPAYLATVAAHDAALDLAVLTITGDDQERPRASDQPLPFLSLGDSDALRLGDPLHVFGYPGIGGDTLTYTVGVVSGFEHVDGIAGVAWIKTDATMAGGSSGGAAVNAAGALVGVPTQGTALECRPGDTNGDGTTSAADVGCVPTGGSIGEVRPINLAKPLLAQAGFVDEINTPPPATPSPEPTVTATNAAPTRTPIVLVTATAATHATATTVAQATATVAAREAQTARATMAAYCANGPLYAPGTRVRVTIPWTRVGATEREQKIELIYAAVMTGKAGGVGLSDGTWYSHDDLVTMTPEERQAVADQWLITVVRSHPAMIIPPLLTDAPANDAEVVGLLHEGVVLSITGPYAEGGDCDWWPVQVIDPHGAATLQAGQTGYVLEQYLRPAA